MAVSGATQTVDASDLDALHDVAQQIRVDSIRCSTHAGSGHPTSSMSAADLITVLAARHLRYDWDRPEMATNDHLIFSKGHASPLLYSLYRACGVVDEEEFMAYRTLGSRLEGHPTPALPWVDVATGSLGQGLPIGVGVALAGKKLESDQYRVYVLCGDSELAEGSIWEALDKAAFYGLDNLCVIFDINRLGQRGPTELQWELEPYRARVEAFGCHPIVIDGHDLRAIDAAFDAAQETTGKPTVIVARTVKGKGFSEIEDKNGWHGKPLPPDMAERAIKELGGERNLRIDIAKPEASQAFAKPHFRVAVELPTYSRDDKVATRKAFGDALKALGVRKDIVVIDAEVGNSTHAEEFGKEYPERYFEVFIAEQQMVSTAVGMSVRGYTAFAATFAAFFTRAYDFIRMASVSQANIRLSGSHAGVEIGADGPSQMGLEDLAALRAVRGSTVLYPGDPVATVKLTAAMADLPGVSYIRTTRGAYPTLYDNSEEFPIGGSKVVVQHDDDRICLIGAGVTLHTCLEAEKTLAGQGIAARVIDLYSVKPVDVVTLRQAADATNGRFVIVEDHYPEGGLASAVLEALSGDGRALRVRRMAVSSLPGSGSTDALLAQQGIDAESIVDVAALLASEA